MNKKTALVVSAHSADFVWRAGGAIALHAEEGVAVTVVCLSYGERGESAKLWRQPGMTLERVKSARCSPRHLHFPFHLPQARFEHEIENVIERRRSAAT